jgi:hypothetical protein
MQDHTHIPHVAIAEKYASEKIGKVEQQTGIMNLLLLIIALAQNSCTSLTPLFHASTAKVKLITIFRT